MTWSITNLFTSTEVFTARVRGSDKGLMLQNVMCMVYSDSECNIKDFSEISKV